MPTPEELADALYGLPDEYGPVKIATRHELRELARAVAEQTWDEAMRTAQIEFESWAPIHSRDTGDVFLADLVKEQIDDYLNDNPYRLPDSNGDEK